MAKQLEMSPNQPYASSGMQREHLRSKVFYSEFLHDNGPIGTFIHANPLHSLEHLYLEQAIAEDGRLIGGQSYLSNDESIRLYRTDRITDRDVKEALYLTGRKNTLKRLWSETTDSLDSYDVPRVHFPRGIEPLDPVHLSGQVHCDKTTKQFGEDHPDAAQTALLEKAGTDPRLSLDPIGRRWTPCDRVQNQKLYRTINQLVTCENTMHKPAGGML